MSRPAFAKKRPFVQPLVIGENAKPQDLEV